MHHSRIEGCPEFAASRREPCSAGPCHRLGGTFLPGLSVAVMASILLFCNLAHAVDPPIPTAQVAPRRERPWAVRAELNMIPLTSAQKHLRPNSSGDDSFGGISLSRNFFEALAAEVTLGYGLDNGFNGPQLMALGRYTYVLGSQRTHGIGAALGPLLSPRSLYGDMKSIHAELSYEYRSLGGLTLFAAFGRDYVFSVNDFEGRATLCGATCPPTVGSGFSVFHIRYAAGFSF
jgi:hypothetical protein